MSIISHCKRELLSLAKNKHRGILFIETKNLSPILDIPRCYRDHVEINHICSIPPHTIHWTNFKGESINPNDKNKYILHGWSINWNKETQREEIISPEHEGRWDTPRSSSTPLNKHTIHLLLFHNPRDPIIFTHKNSRHLSNILSRISVPIPPEFQFENNVPILHLYKQKQSLALRHQPHIPSDPLDIYQSLRECQFFPGEIPIHSTYSPSFKSFQPLLDLKELPLISDGHIPTQLINYCASKDKTNPEDDASSIVAFITQCTTQIETDRRDRILNLMYLLGSPVLHLETTNDDECTHLLSCQKCNRQATTLWEIPKDINFPKTISLRDEIISSLISKDLFFTTQSASELTREKLKSQYKSQCLFTCFHCAIKIQY